MVTNTLFYSIKCDTCIHLIQILKRENLLRYFKLYAVDDRLDSVPSWLKLVPSMLVCNEPRPIIGQETFIWVQNNKQNEQLQKSEEHQEPTFNDWLDLAEKGLLKVVI